MSCVKASVLVSLLLYNMSSDAAQVYPSSLLIFLSVLQNSSGFCMIRIAGNSSTTERNWLRQRRNHKSCKQPLRKVGGQRGVGGSGDVLGQIAPHVKSGILEGAVAWVSADVLGLCPPWQPESGGVATIFTSALRRWEV